MVNDLNESRVINQRLWYIYTMRKIMIWSEHGCILVGFDIAILW